LPTSFANRKTRPVFPGAPPPKALARCRLPVLLIHGSDDRFVPVEMTYENYRACSAPKDLVIVPGADHGMSHFTEKDRYEQTVLEFWKKYDQ
jgi:fermentation-respiration switch protein FrsA (DUF1100 family)